MKLKTRWGGLDVDQKTLIVFLTGAVLIGTLIVVLIHLG